MSYSLSSKAAKKKITSQGCPSEAGEKSYYFNYSCYCLGYFFIAKPAGLSWQSVFLETVFLETVFLETILLKAFFHSAFTFKSCTF